MLQTGDGICKLKKSNDISVPQLYNLYGAMLIAQYVTQNGTVTEKVLAERDGSDKNTGNFIMAFYEDENPETGESTLLDIARPIHLGINWIASKTPSGRKDTKEAFINSLAEILQEKDLTRYTGPFNKDLQNENTDNSR